MTRIDEEEQELTYFDEIQFKIIYSFQQLILIKFCFGFIYSELVNVLISKVLEKDNENSYSSG